MIRFLLLCLTAAGVAGGGCDLMPEEDPGYSVRGPASSPEPGGAEDVVTADVLTERPLNEYAPPCADCATDEEEPLDGHHAESERLRGGTRRPPQH
jgi:hypothetical protein